MDPMDFSGAKLILLIGGKLVTIRRDDHPDIPWPGMWDLPGGGREDGESAVACVLRETAEELGLRLPVEALIWRRAYAVPVPAWFFLARLPAGAERRIVLGDEGQGWALADPWGWIGRADSIPHFRARVAQAIQDMPDL